MGRQEEKVKDGDEGGLSKLRKGIVALEERAGGG